MLRVGPATLPGTISGAYAIAASKSLRAGELEPRGTPQSVVFRRIFSTWAHGARCGNEVDRK